MLLVVLGAWLWWSIEMFFRISWALWRTLSMLNELLLPMLWKPFLPPDTVSCSLRVKNY
jgi:hypothetical protein